MHHFDSTNLDLNGKRILVTGGTGSFGQAFVRTVIERYRPAKLIVFSRDEMKQYEMAQAICQQRYPCIRYFIGDVRDESRLELAMREVDLVVHAAALKHVPAAEYNPFECIQTNVHGAENVVKAALKCEVGQVLALSTDKAVSPINLYGASKLAADKIFVAANNLSGTTRTRFAVVRYGNVLGSRGSVVPYFRRLLADGADSLPITDRRMTRFWITLRQGVDFVLSCLVLMRGGEIFVPKIPSSSIVELAECMAPGLPLREIGIRPGEKLHEALTTSDDSRSTLELADRYVIEPAFAYWSRKPYSELGARPVAEDFHYGSDNNPERLEKASLSALLKSLDG